MKRKNQKGISLIEVLILVVVIGIIFASGSSVFLRQINVGSDLITYSQAVNLANQLMEIRRVSGRFPNEKELEKSIKLDFSVSEEKYGNTDLTKVIVKIKWYPSKEKERKIKLVSLMKK